MSAVWIIIANSRFPAELIESSKEAGVKDVDFPFEISADYIPRLNSYVEGRIIDFSEGLPPDTPEFEMIVHKSQIMAEDLSLLTDYFLEDINNDFKNQKGWTPKSISISGRRAIAAYSWPGNVRELQNTLMRMAIWSMDGVITAKDVENSLLGMDDSVNYVLGRPLGGGFDLEGLLGEVAAVYLERAMDQAGDNKSAAADLLGFKNYQTLSNWLKRYGMDSSKD